MRANLARLHRNTSLWTHLYKCHCSAFAIVDYAIIETKQTLILDPDIVK